MTYYHKSNKARYAGSVNASDIPALKRAVEQMSDRQLEFFAVAFKAAAPTESRAVVLSEIARRCIMAYVSVESTKGLGE